MMPSVWNQNERKIRVSSLALSAFVPPPPLNSEPMLPSGFTSQCSGSSPSHSTPEGR